MSRSRKALLLIVSGVFLLTIGAVLIFVFIRPWPSDAPSQQVKEDRVNSPSGVIIMVSQKAQALAEDGRVEESYKLLDAEIEKTDDDQEKAALYTAKSVIASSDPAVGTHTAIEYAIQADALYATADTAAHIAFLYESQGDTANALVYYRRALERETEKASTVAVEDQTKSKTTVSNAPYYQSKIEALMNE